MTDQRLNAEDAANTARALLEKSVEDRVAAVRALVAATNDVDDKEQAAKDARDAHTSAWATALTSGWSEKELRATGVRPPGQTRPRTPRRTSRTDTTTQPTE
ncbi:hypothetical protein [Rathayibacter sp. AY1B8]|uniref:hypothetical protein n=1 Tax=Rathayibacter sp. AY1B8 TaxID=2080533 RepID=UPI0011B0541F|nr:hypothetical protein [Rathayibacter sp. AY1B8]